MHSSEFAEIYIERAGGLEVAALSKSGSEFASCAGALTLKALNSDIEFADAELPETEREVNGLLLRSFGEQKDLRKYYRAPEELSGDANAENPSFKVLSFSMFGYWVEIAQQVASDSNDKHPPSLNAIGSALASLHVNGALIMHMREKVICTVFGHDQDKYLDDIYSPQRSHLEGTLSEIDAAIILVDVCRDEGWWVLPASPFFESSQRVPRYNADFIIIDPIEETAAGVQVKSSVQRHEEQRYAKESEGIAIVDCRNDLGNSKRISHSSISRRAGKLATFSGSVIEACLQYSEGKGNRDLIKHRRADKIFDMFVSRKIKEGPKNDTRSKRAKLMEAHEVKKAIVRDRVIRALHAEGAILLPSETKM